MQHRSQGLWSERGGDKIRDPGNGVADVDEILSSMSCVKNIVASFLFSFQDRAHKDEKDFRRHANIQELVTLKESEKHLQQELERTKELLRLEQQNHRETIAKVLITARRYRARQKCCPIARG